MSNVTVDDWASAAYTALQGMLLFANLPEKVRPLVVTILEKAPVEVKLAGMDMLAQGISEGRHE